MSVKFHFDDILIKPALISEINGRSEVNTYTKFGMLPLITAPMYDVVGPNSAFQYEKNKINPIIPRGSVVDGEYMQAYGLYNFKSLFLNKDYPCTKDKPAMALIDIANGHMSNVLNYARSAKLKYGKKLVLMVGNVANPDTFKLFSQIGVDYVRVGIGNGGTCLTTEQTGVGYPLASLIAECKEIKRRSFSRTKIVADGGIRKYSDIIKSLALGADYVMIGSILNKAFESEGELFFKYGSDFKVVDSTKLMTLKANTNEIDSLIKQGVLYKLMRGMSTKSAQLQMGAPEDKLKTSEGVVKYQQVEYRLSQWVENFEHYLRSAMSYTNCTTLKEFNNVGENIIKITDNAYKGYTK